MVKLLILLLLSGCATRSIVLQSDFDHYQSEFHKQFPKTKTAAIVFGKVYEDKRPGFVRAGECHDAYFSQRIPLVIINQEVWNRFNAKQRKTLIFHELGHCLLGLEHSDHGFMKPIIK